MVHTSSVNWCAFFMDLQKLRNLLIAPAQPNLTRWQMLFLALGCVCSTLLAAYCLWSIFQIGLNNDHLAIFKTTRVLLSGGTPYVDYSDVNAPPVTLLYIIPWLLSSALGISMAVALDVSVCALMIVSARCSQQIMLRGGLTPLAAQVAACGLALSWCATALQFDVFGDRVHLMMLLITPWLLWCAPLPSRKNIPVYWRVAAATLATVGFIIKHDYYVFFVATLCARFLRKPHWRSVITWEDGGIVALSGLYAVSLFFYFPHYVLSVLPVGWHVYEYLGWSWESKVEVLRHQFLRHYAWPVLLCLPVLLLRRELLRGWGGYLLVLLLAATASFAINRGWWYSHYPFSALCFFSTACLMGAISKHIRLVVALPWLFFAAHGLWKECGKTALNRATVDLNMQAARGHPMVNVELFPAAKDQLTPYLKQYPRFMFLSINLMVESMIGEDRTLENLSRFDYLWSLPGAVALAGNEKKLASRKMVEAYTIGSITDDILRKKPPLIIIDKNPSMRALPANFDILEWLLRDNDFAQTWKHYTLLATIDTCGEAVFIRCRYTLHQRKPD